MARLTPIHWKKFERFLLHVGCVLKRQESSHRVYWRDDLNRPIIMQAKSQIPVFIILNNLRTLDMDRDAYLKIIDTL